LEAASEVYANILDKPELREKLHKLGSAYYEVKGRIRARTTQVLRRQAQGTFHRLW